MLSVLPAAPGQGYPLFFALYEKSYNYDIRRAEGVLSREKENCLRWVLSRANTNVDVGFTDQLIEGRRKYTKVGQLIF